MKISYESDELLLKGDKQELLELSNYVKEVALKDGDNHIHIDDLTLIDKDSSIKNLIIEKKEK